MCSFYTCAVLQITSALLKLYPTGRPSPQLHGLDRDRLAFCTTDHKKEGNSVTLSATLLSKSFHWYIRVCHAHLKILVHVQPSGPGQEQYAIGRESQGELGQLWFQRMKAKRRIDGMSKVPRNTATRQTGGAWRGKTRKKKHTQDSSDLAFIGPDNRLFLTCMRQTEVRGKWARHCPRFR
jgi:hypothetical protein